MLASPSPPPLVLRGRRFDASHRAVMAIINRTSDSFFPGSRHADLVDAVSAASNALSAGADLIDVGAVRAGQEGEWVTADMEVDRLTPFLEQIRERHPDVVVSVDTWRSDVVTRIAHLGIDLVNDTWAGHDPDLVFAAADIGAGVVCSHTGGLAPRTDPVNMTYLPEPDGVVDSVLSTLAAAGQRALDAGIPRERILVDPTLDFGKTTRHSLRTLRATPHVVALGFPVLQAISRKDFIGETLDLPVEERLHGTLAATSIAAWLGATVFRSHDVAATRQVLDMVSSIEGARSPAVSVRGEPVKEG